MKKNRREQYSRGLAQRLARISEKVFANALHSRREPIMRRRRNGRADYSTQLWRVHYWIAGQWCITNTPCHCGRDHYAVQSKSALGDELHCPVTWWGRLKLFEPGFTKDLDQMIRRIDMENRGRVPPEELERWEKELKQRGEAALEELRKLDPAVVQAIRDAIAQRNREMADALWGRDKDWESLI